MMAAGNTIYLIDSNSLITPYQVYYPFDLAPNFWIKMKQAIDGKRVVIMDLVKQELGKGEDRLSEWVDEIDDTLILSRKDPLIVQKYSEVLDYIQTCGFYKISALQNWARSEIADPWLIAAGAAGGYTIITQETANGNLNVKNQSKNAKIPDICSVFKVKCETLFEMMRDLSLTV